MAFRLHDEPGVPGSADDEIRRCQAQLINGAPSQQRAAAARLIELRAETALLECLHAHNSRAVELATGALWECWMNEQGAEARREMERGIRKMDEGDLAGALELFGKLVVAYPRWAEAHNKQATVFYLLGNARLSYQVCETVIALKPKHFGAWNGMALCAAQMERWPAALRAARQALSLQPSASANLDLIRLAEAKLAEEND